VSLDPEVSSFVVEVSTVLAKGLNGFVEEEIFTAITEVDKDAVVDRILLLVLLLLILVGLTTVVVNVWFEDIVKTVLVMFCIPLVCVGGADEGDMFGCNEDGTSGILIVVVDSVPLEIAVWFEDGLIVVCCISVVEC